MQWRGHCLFRQQTHRLPCFACFHGHVQAGAIALEPDGALRFGRGLERRFSKPAVFETFANSIRGVSTRLHSSPFAVFKQPDKIMPIQLRDKAQCQFDMIALGEIMLRLDPGEGRIRCAREFKVWEGGGEYNVARGLRRCFGLKTAVCTAFSDNDVGHLLEDFILQGGVNTGFIKWLPFDGVGRVTRNGLNFTERGFGVRGAVGVSDRGHTAASQLRPGDVDWDHLFGELGVRWLHTGGIFAALSASAAATVIEAVTAAKRHGTVVSYDLNYRPSLWKAIGGQAKAQEVNHAIAPYIDVMIGNEEDFTASLGFEVEGVDQNLSTLQIDKFAAMITKAAAAYPNFQVIATTMRTVHTASINDW